MDKLTVPGGARLAHAYMIVSPNEDARNSAAGRLAAAMLCEGDGPRPCGACRACRKALAGIHPDISVVEPGLDAQGRKRREILVDAVRALASDAQVMPNEASGRVFIIRDADTMNPQAQNALLKLLEEPPAGVSFVLCAANEARLLPTVRSRCERLRVNADAAESEEAASDADALLEKLCSGSRTGLCEWCFENEGMDARRCEAMLRAAREALADSLRSEAGRAQGAYLDALLARCGEYLRRNVGVKAVLGLIAVDGIQK